MQRHQRARSLEHILDQGSSIGPNYWVADGAKLISHKRGGGGASISQAHTPSMTPRNNNTRPLPQQPAYLQQQQRASSVERMLDESSLDTNSTSVPSYCTVDRRIKPRPRRPPTSSDESSDIPPRPLRPRVYKVNSFQQRPGQQTVELYVDQKHHRGHTMASNRYEPFLFNIGIKKERNRKRKLVNIGTSTCTTFYYYAGRASIPRHAI